MYACGKGTPSVAHVNEKGTLPLCRQRKCPWLDQHSMSVYERAVFYHFIHAMGLLVVSILPRLGAVSLTAGSWVCALLLTGVVIFSGSLYLLAVTGIGGLGAITPIGGLSFIAAWVLLAIALLQQAKSE